MGLPTPVLGPQDFLGRTQSNKAASGRAGPGCLPLLGRRPLSLLFTPSSSASASAAQYSFRLGGISGNAGRRTHRRICWGFLVYRRCLSMSGGLPQPRQAQPLGFLPPFVALAGEIGNPLVTIPPYVIDCAAHVIEQRAKLGNQGIGQCVLRLRFGFGLGRLEHTKQLGGVDVPTPASSRAPDILPDFTAHRMVDRSAPCSAVLLRHKGEFSGRSKPQTYGAGTRLSERGQAEEDWDYPRPFSFVDSRASSSRCSAAASLPTAAKTLCYGLIKSATLTCVLFTTGTICPNLLRRHSPSTHAGKILRLAL